jgi:hypothetical protein
MTIKMCHSALLFVVIGLNIDLHAQESIPLGAGKTEVVKDAASKAWLELGLVQVFLDKRDEIMELGVSSTQIAKLEGILDTFAERQKAALADARNAEDFKGGQDVENVKLAMVQEAQEIVNKADKECSDWVRENFDGEMRRRIIIFVIRAMKGYEPLTTDLVADHLKLSEKQREVIVELNSEQSRFVETVIESKGIEGLAKPSAFVTNTLDSFAARLFDILDEPQMNEFLFATGQVGQGEGIAEFLEKMPNDVRQRLVSKSQRLNQVWNAAQEATEK